MPFEAKETKFTVLLVKNKLYNLINAPINVRLAGGGGGGGHRAGI